MNRIVPTWAENCHIDSQVVGVYINRDCTIQDIQFSSFLKFRSETLRGELGVLEVLTLARKIL